MIDWLIDWTLRYKVCLCLIYLLRENIEETNRDSSTWFTSLYSPCLGLQCYKCTCPSKKASKKNNFYFCVLKKKKETQSSVISKRRYESFLFSSFTVFSSIFLRTRRISVYWWKKIAVQFLWKKLENLVSTRWGFLQLKFSKSRSNLNQWDKNWAFYQILSRATEMWAENLSSQRTIFKIKTWKKIITFNFIAFVSPCVASKSS